MSESANPEFQTVVPEGNRRQVLGRRLTRLREAAGLSQREAAETSAVGQKTISRAESGEAVEEEALSALMAAYGEPPRTGPIDPLRRIEWVAQRSRLIGAAKAPASGTYGKPAKR